MLEIGMKRTLSLILVVLFLLSGCTAGADVKEMPNDYVRISQEEAKEMMDTQNVLILDVREQHEYEEGHIPNAVLLPVDTITAQTAAEQIPSLDTVVLVYCRSGNRSQRASAALAELGYTAVYEFGGIQSWAYEIER